MQLSEKLSLTFIQDIKFNKLPSLNKLSSIDVLFKYITSHVLLNPYYTSFTSLFKKEN